MTDISLADVTVAGSLKHGDNTTAESYHLDISANNIDIQSTGSINLNTLGFRYNYGPGKG